MAARPKLQPKPIKGCPSLLIWRTPGAEGGLYKFGPGVWKVLLNDYYYGDFPSSEAADAYVPKLLKKIGLTPKERPKKKG